MHDQLTAEAITAGLHTTRLGRSLRILPETDSTNTQAKLHFSREADGFVLLAETQTAGRGRMGRKFVSPAGSGLYLSIVLHPDLPFAQLSLLTLAAAVAVCEALEQPCGLSPRIKWVNDVFLGEHKCAGILSESAFSSGGNPDFSVVGIGVNLRFDRDAYPDLSGIAGAIADETELVPTRAALAAAILNAFEPWYDRLLAGQTASLLAAYRNRLNCLNRRILVYTAQSQYEAVCVGLNDEGNLIVQREDGTQDVLCAGEIRIKL